MLYIPFLILLASAALCLGLSRLLPTQVLGYGAAAAALLAGVALLVLGRGPLPLGEELLQWGVPGTFVINLGLRLDAPALALGLLLLWGGALALLALAAALATSLRGFGALFGCGLLTLAAGLAALWSSGPLLHSAAWSLLALASFGCAWSSGALGRSQGVSLGLGHGLLAGLLLLVGLLPGNLGDRGAATLPASLGAALCVLLALLLATGLPPFGSALDDLLAGPAALTGLLAGLGLPLVALATICRLAESPQLAAGWRTTLVIGGLLALLVCAAAALGERRLKALLGWQLGAQAGAVLVAAGLYQASPATPQLQGPWLLLSNLALTTLAGALAVAPMERAGGDDFTLVGDNSAEKRAGPPLLLAGVAWGLAGASAVGLPPLWGFWGRRWLLEAALERAPWAIAPLLAGGTLAALAYLLPLAAFLRRPGEIARVVDDSSTEVQQRGWPGALGLLPAGLLLLLGVAPGLAWPLPLAVGSEQQAAALALLLLAVLLALLLRRRSSGRRVLPDADMAPALLAPDALSQSLRPLAWLGNPVGLLGGAWRGLLALGEGVQIIMALFERRYYLAGVLLALISVILVMAQQ